MNRNCPNVSLTFSFLWLACSFIKQIFNAHKSIYLYELSYCYMSQTGEEKSIPLCWASNFFCKFVSIDNNINNTVSSSIKNNWSVHCNDHTREQAHNTERTVLAAVQATPVSQRLRSKWTETKWAGKVGSNGRMNSTMEKQLSQTRAGARAMVKARGHAGLD